MTIIIEDALKFAVDKEELFLTYQPIYNLLTQKMIGMETLTYWKHPTLGLISPDIFIPIAEENGLIDVIGKWTFQNAFTQGAKWYLAGYQQFKLAINISPRHLLQHDLPQLLLDLINYTQVPPHILELELTETAAMTHIHDAERIIESIRALGIGIALDDFGTGYSSLIHLKSLTINTIKIDKVFITDITTNPKDIAIVKAIIDLGKNLNIAVIAEGIETQAQLQTLLVNNCREGQGFYFSKPLFADQITEILKQF